MTFPWLKQAAFRIAAFSGAQAVIQGLNALSGFLLVRGMGKQEYGWFTIMNSLLATINILTDSGLGSAFSSIGGRHVTHGAKFAAIVSTARSLRTVFLVASLCITLPAGIYVLRLNHTPVWVTSALSLVLLASALPIMETSLLAAVNRIHSRVRQVVQADLSTSALRLGIICAASLTTLNALVAALATTITQWFQWLLLRRQTADLVNVPPDTEEDFREPMLQVVRHMLPICAFQCVQGHITTWLLSMFATTEKVADVGALARLGILFTFLFLPWQNFAFPAIARSTDTSRLARLSLLAVLSAMVVSGATVIGCLLLSKQVLWLLGSNYTHLRVELGWYLGSLAVAFVANTVWGVALTKSWVRHGWLHIPITVLAQIAAAMILDLSQTTHAIAFAAVSNVAGFAVAAVLVVLGLLGNKTSEAARSSSPPV